MSYEYDQLVENATRVRIYDMHSGKTVMAEGVVIGYQTAPTLLIRHDDGTQSSWSVELPREESTWVRRGARSG